MGDLGAAGNRAQPSVFIEYRGDLGRSSAPAIHRVPEADFGNVRDCAMLHQ